MPQLKPDPVLSDFQTYVTAMEAERGFSGQTPVEKCLLLGEEVGELFKAVRNVQGIAIDDAFAGGEIADELADILIYLCAIANRYQIDLETAFRTKEERNRLRTWSSRTAAAG